MPWIRQRKAKTTHSCIRPMRYFTVAPLIDILVPDGKLNDLWRCDECSQLWRVGRACDYCDNNRGFSPHYGQHQVGLQWRHASLFQQLLYRKG